MDQDYGDMPVEDFVHNLYKNVLAIKHLLWMVVFLLGFIAGVVAF